MITRLGVYVNKEGIGFMSILRVVVNHLLGLVTSPEGSSKIADLSDCVVERKCLLNLLAYLETSLTKHFNNCASHVCLPDFFLCVI